eukprot:SAG31_NODE_1296_length_8945_cov_6.341510_11_plen_103_part_00
MAVAEIERSKAERDAVRQKLKLLRAETPPAGSVDTDNSRIDGMLIEAAKLARRERAAKKALRRAEETAAALVWLGGVVEQSRQEAHKLFTAIDGVFNCVLRM